MTSAKLEAEIEGDPLGYGYKYSTGRWRGRSTIAGLLNRRHVIKVAGERDRFVSPTELFDAIDRDDLDELNEPDSAYLFSLFSFGGEWDFDGETMQGEIRSIFAGSQTWANWEALVAGTDVEQSRAGYLWGEGTEVTPEDVEAAAAL